MKLIPHIHIIPLVLQFLVKVIIYVGQMDLLTSYSVYSEELPLLKLQLVPSLRNYMALLCLLKKHCLILPMCLGPSFSIHFTSF